MKAATALLALSTVLIIGCGEPSARPAGGSAAPDFTVQTFEDESFHLAQHRGRVVVINFWESW